MRARLEMHVTPPCHPSKLAAKGLSYRPQLTHTCVDGVSHARRNHTRSTRVGVGVRVNLIARNRLYV